jgi:hypothetical protein
MNFASFDKNNLNELRSEMNELLQKYGMESNLEIQVGNMSFTDASVNIKVTAKVKGLKTREDKVFDAQVVELNLKTTNSRGDKLVGYKAANWKMPYLYVSGNGKSYKCDERTAKKLFAA